MQALSVIYHTLFNPVETFQAISEEDRPKDALLIYATAIVVVVSAVGVVSSPVIDSTGGLILKIIFAIISGLIFWLFSSAIFAIAAYVFGQQGRPQTLLILTGFSTLPWILLPAVMLFKDMLGILGNTIAVFGSLGLWIWTSILFLMAIRYTYHLTLERVLLAAGLPMLMTFVGISWVGGFFFNLVQYLS